MTAAVACGLHYCGPPPLKRPFPMGACALPAEKTEPPEHSPAKQRKHWRQSAFPC
jgi:hypothetical protein